MILVWMLLGQTALLYIMRMKLIRQSCVMFLLSMLGLTKISCTFKVIYSY
ncbi:hypothetical protein ACJIZ3_025283 [Penstemon smallii]|uniref:Uncharacterized protein n=1 Tax=Penstemon smallii TaxID=265156 RepID=A0ABD3TUC6_9LAMI